MKNNSESPIGIFDSGIGGLTVAHAIHQILPNEQIIYFGDTAHLPYGDKSEAAIQAYSIKIADVLLEKKCKVIVIACNSASATSYNLLKEYVGGKAHIMNVIDPMIEFVAAEYQGKKIGIIGTKRTIQSGIYTQKLKETNANINIQSLPTPLLAPMIEEGFFNNQISHEIIASYLSDAMLKSIEVLILACTHYPLIRKEIEEYYQNSIVTLDSAMIVAIALTKYLAINHLHNTTTHEANHHFLVSDFTESFEASTLLFFGEKVKLEWHPLWN